MAFVIDNEYLPATLTAQPMSDEAFIEFCSEHPDLNFEMSAEGEIIVMAPTFFFGRPEFRGGFPASELGKEGRSRYRL